jgi:hypothetical protein
MPVVDVRVQTRSADWLDRQPVSARGGVRRLAGLPLVVVVQAEEVQRLAH